MRVYFIPLEHIIKGYYTIQLEFCDDILDSYILMELLEKTFQSIDFDDYYNNFDPSYASSNMFFRFKEKEDEAMFLLWSSDGIEL